MRKDARVWIFSVRTALREAPWRFRSFEARHSARDSQQHKARVLAQSALSAFQDFGRICPPREKRSLAELGFVRFERVCRWARRVRFRATFFTHPPLLEHRERRESAEEFARACAWPPGGSGSTSSSLRDGPAAADSTRRCARIRVGDERTFFHFLDDAVHPKGRPRWLGRDRRSVRRSQMHSHRKSARWCLPTRCGASPWPIRAPIE